MFSTQGLGVILQSLLSFLADPYRFSLFIMLCYSINGVQFAVRGLWWDALYWAAAFLITLSVTFRPH